MARGSKIGKIREYFRTAELDEAEVVFALVDQDIAKRKQPVQESIPFTRPRRAKRTKKSNAEPAEHHEMVSPQMADGEVASA